MRILRTTATLLTLAACTPGEQAAQAATPATISAEQFRTIAWMNGRWLGTGAGVPAFYESYRLADDSTLHGNTWADSTFAMATDTSMIALRGGRVTSGQAPNGYNVTAWDSTGIHFAPMGTRTNGFTWTQVDADHWTATLTWKDRAGKPQQRVYQMARVGPG